uniref:Putative secreted protein n=1 Tax=Desmodus rotundus TaxID=9430 RepID=K9IFV2_DESRO
MALLLSCFIIRCWSSYTLPRSEKAPSSAPSHCRTASKGNRYAQQTTFCLPRWVLSPLTPPAWFPSQQLSSACLHTWTDSLHASSLREIPTPRLAPNSAATCANRPPR